MEKFKFIVFIELMALSACAILHLVALVAKTKFPLTMYPTALGVVLICCLLAIFVFEPLYTWFIG